MDRGKWQGNVQRRPVNEPRRSNADTAPVPAQAQAPARPAQAPPRVPVSATPPTAGAQTERRSSVEDLKVFQLAHDLVLKVYQATAHFPREETFGLSAQLRRAAASVPASLVEGAARNRSGYRELIGDAKASAAEARYHLLLARDLGYVAQKDCDELRERYDHACRMLAKLSQALAGPGRSQAATPSARQ